jgi:prolyl oligopeptidase
MRRHLPCIVIALLTAHLPRPALADELRALKYPPTKMVDAVEDYHGTRIADPYRWLEDPRSEDTKSWIAAQNELTFAYLRQLPARERLRKRLAELWNHERYGLPVRRGGRYFFTRNDGLQEQSVLYVGDSLDARPRVLLDPNALSPDGSIALVNFAPSDDGRLLAYSLSRAGSDWQEWRVRDVSTGQDLADHLRWVKFSSASWTKDGQGFFYSRYPEPPPDARPQDANYYHKLYFHRLGTPQSQDLLIYQRPDHKDWSFSGYVTEDGRYLVISVWLGTERRNGVVYKSLEALDGPIVELLNQFDAQYDFIGNDGPVFWFRTDRDAPRGRVIAIDTASPHPQAWRELIPQTAQALQDATAVGDCLIGSYLKDSHSVVRVHDLEGRLVREVELPGLGSASGFAGRRESSETFYRFASFTEAGAIYRYDAATGKTSLFRRPRLDFDASAYETRQVFYTSRDGTRIPMFLTHRKGLRPNGSHRTLLYGYGGFNNSQTPSFSVTTLVWLEQGGVYAVPNLRGGGEYGKAWHEAGRKQLKQNVFDDFVAAAQWLIDQRYTSPQRLAISGRSNGGLLVGACLTQRPELFGACLPGVGVMDMLRYHKFTIGWAWVPEYGSSDDPSDFKYLLAYSPLHNIRAGVRYPPTLITTADHDDRVVPAHSFKFAAALQAAQAGEAPVLIRIETTAGHGALTPTTQLIDEAADRLAFALHALQGQ